MSLLNHIKQRIWKFEDYFSFSLNSAKIPKLKLSTIIVVLVSLSNTVESLSVINTFLFLALLATEVRLELNDVMFANEEIMYTLESLISDVGGSLGFFLGLSLLQCIMTTWRYIRSKLYVFRPD